MSFYCKIVCSYTPLNWAGVHSNPTHTKLLKWYSWQTTMPRGPHRTLSPSPENLCNFITTYGPGLFWILTPNLWQFVCDSLFIHYHTLVCKHYNILCFPPKDSLVHNFFDVVRGCSDKFILVSFPIFFLCVGKQYLCMYMSLACLACLVKTLVCSFSGQTLV